MPQVQILPAAPGFGEQLGQQLGSGLGQGLAGGLQQMLERKSNTKSAESLADQLGLKDDQKKSFVGTFGKVPAKEQFSALEQMMTAQVLGQYLQGKQPATQPSIEPKTATATTTTTTQRTPIPAVGELIPLATQEREERKIAIKQDLAKEKAAERSYEIHKDYINDITSQYKGFETEMKPRLLQMQNLKDEDLVGPTSAKFLEAIGIPLGALENPGSELYQKLSQDLLKGLPETYGSRILKVEVENFLKTIPTLLNSPDGRRMIASNALKLGEMKEVFYKEMRKQQINLLDSAEKFPRDFEQRVFDNVKPQIDKLNNEFIKLTQIKSVPKNTIPFFNPQGEISFVPNTQDAINWAEKNGGKRVW